jgi:hypothetical protein
VVLDDVERGRIEHEQARHSAHARMGFRAQRFRVRRGSPGDQPPRFPFASSVPAPLSTRPAQSAFAI